MKFLIFGLALIATAMADVSELGYDYHPPTPVEHHEVDSVLPELPQKGYIPPSLESPVPAPVSQNAYIPPAPVHEAVSEPEVPFVGPQNYIPPSLETPASGQVPVHSQNSYIPPEGPATVPALPQNNAYIPPDESAPVPESNAYIPPAAETPVEPSAEFTDDGYHYKTIRRRVYRYRH